MINPQGVVNLGIVCALHLCVCRCIPATYPGVLQAAGKERGIARPPADNNHHYTQTVTTLASEVCPLIMTDLMLGL